MERVTVLTVLQNALNRRLREVAEAAHLTGREREVLCHLAEGCSHSEIACLTGCAERTVKFHQHNLLRKTGAESRSDLWRVLLHEERHAAGLAALRDANSNLHRRCQAAESQALKGDAHLAIAALLDELEKLRAALDRLRTEVLPRLAMHDVGCELDTDGTVAATIAEDHPVCDCCYRQHNALLAAEIARVAELVTKETQ